jgi:hypothetical protein
MRALIIAAALLMGSMALAQNLQLDIFSPTENTCADWAASSRNPAVRNQYFMWFLGFVSGHNYRSMDAQVPRSRIPDEKQFTAMVDKSCAGNPRQSISVIALRFVDENRPRISKHSTKK